MKNSSTKPTQSYNETSPNQTTIIGKIFSFFTIGQALKRTRADLKAAYEKSEELIKQANQAEKTTQKIVHDPNFTI